MKSETNKVNITESDSTSYNLLDSDHGKSAFFREHFCELLKFWFTFLLLFICFALEILSTMTDQYDALVLKTKITSSPVPAISHIHFRRSYEEAIKNSELSNNSTSNLSYPTEFINKKLKLISENLTRP